MRTSGGTCDVMPPWVWGLGQGLAFMPPLTTPIQRAKQELAM